jgi:aldose 1-epimerase
MQNDIAETVPLAQRIIPSEQTPKVKMPENITINSEFASVTISPDAGASLRSIKVHKNGNSFELLSGGDNAHDPTELPHGEGSFVMAPWVNRIRDGRLVTPDGIYELPMNQPPHAIHGLERDRVWTVKSVGESSLELEINLAQPWPYDGKVEYSLSFEGASFIQTMRLIADKNETRSFPGSVGWHPWFNPTLGSGPVTATADVSAQWEMKDMGTASGKLEITGITERLQQGTQFEVREVDGCFLLNKGGGAVLSWPELTMTMTNSETITHFMFFSPEHALCVEPQTCTVDAARLADSGHADTGHVLVDRENPLIATTTWSWE